MILVFSCSLNAESRSAALARAAAERFTELGESVEFVDLREHPLPFCDGVTAYGDPNARRLGALAADADAIVVAAPVYNYGVSAAAKNLVELTGRSWTGKTIGLLLAAGGQASYMSGMGLANSLMLDFRCLVVPRYVYAVGDAFDDGSEEPTAVTAPEILLRIDELAREVVRISRALRAAPPHSP